MSRPSRTRVQLSIAFLMFALASPLVLLAVLPARGGDRLDLFALYLGYLGFTSYAVQLALPARLPLVADAVGVPLLLRVHRFIGTAVLVVIAAHVAIFAVHRPEYRSWIYWPVPDGPRAVLGWIGAVVVILIALTTWFRRRLRLPFETWRGLHVTLGIGGCGAALAHALVISWYTSYAPVRWLLVVIFALGVACIGYLRFLRPFGRLAAPYVITAVTPERGGATTVHLQAVGHPGVQFRPGQFAWLKFHDVTYSLQEHPFSFASSAARPRNPSFTIKASGDFTNSVLRLTPGSRVLLDGPHGAWHPPRPADGYVLIAAGIGITPAMSVIRTLRDTNDPRPVSLIYGAQDWDDVTFRDELEAIANAPGTTVDVCVALSRPSVNWNGVTGRIDAGTLPGLLPADVTRRNVLICGPSDMMHTTRTTLVGLGVPAAHIYLDHF